MTVYQSKAEKAVLFSSTHQPSVNVADNAGKVKKSVKDCNDLKYGVNTVNQMSGNTRLQLSPDSLFICFITHNIWRS